MKGTLTQRGSSVLGSLLVFFLIATLSSEPSFSIASSVLLLVFALEAMRFRRASKALDGLKLGRLADPENLFVGETANVRLEIECYDSRGGGLLEMTDVVPDGLEVVGGSNVLAEGIESRRILAATYTIRAIEMGRKDYAIVEAKLFDRLGLFATEKKLSCSSVMRVFPRIPLAHVEVPGRPRIANRVTERGTAKRILGMEFMGVREYIPGDDHRMIAWKAMAKSPTLSPMTKEHEQMKVLEVYVVFLARTSMQDGPRGQRKIDKAVEASLTLANHAIKEGYTASFIFPQNSNLVMASGSLSQLAILISDMTFDDLSTAEFSKFIKSHIMKRSFILFVADLPYPQSIEMEHIQSLRLNGHIVNLMLFDTPSYFVDQDNEGKGEERLVDEILDKVENEHVSEFMMRCSRLGLRSYLTTPSNISSKMIEAFAEVKRTPLP